MTKSQKDNDRPVAVNKKAFRDFVLVDRFEAGISLLGSEVKSLRNGVADLAGAYAKIEDDQCWLVGSTIAPYEQAGTLNHEPTRKRKLLLHKAEIRKLRTKLELRGFTLVPLKIYFSRRSLAKVELALAHGKRKYDKRKSITERNQKRDVDRDLRKYK